ncbi:MAG: YraN family protein [Candidatus Ratteibacteria bacterium]|nr:YraN family protein [Candidatus Ratteibacteria bacterium]
MNPLKNFFGKIKFFIFPEKREKRDTGKIGEDIAVKFLTRKGYQILERNWKMKAGEIDIVAADGDTMVFVEVKARSSTEYGTGEEAITEHKKDKIINAAKACLKHKGEDRPCRFDVISILLEKNGKIKEINHIEDAFTL